MNTRFMCDNCGSQPCMCQEFECPTCKGEGEHGHPAMPLHDLRSEAPEYAVVKCEDCHGEGVLRCDGPRSTIPSCRFEKLCGTCHCEAAWERQQEDWASEPPMSADERHREAWLDREALRAGINRR